MSDSVPRPLLKPYKQDSLADVFFINSSDSEKAFEIVYAEIKAAFIYFYINIRENAVARINAF